MRRLTAALALVAGMSFAQAPPPAPQNPSPMVESTRAHERLERRDAAGRRVSIDWGGEKEAQLFVPEGLEDAAAADVLIHFHGAAWLPEIAAVSATPPLAVATVHLGAGSSIYRRAFEDPARFDALLAAIRSELARSEPERSAGVPPAGPRVDGGAVPEGSRGVAQRPPEGVAQRPPESDAAAWRRTPAGVPEDPRSSATPPQPRLYLSAFSAGYGAIREILRNGKDVDGVVLLDGLHASYVPERKVLAEGGALDEAALAPFIAFAHEAAASRKAFVITHSEIFPGTFASTTETADAIVAALGLAREPVLEWGPRGMQQLSRVSAGRLRILGFAGNTAPDHVDHFHALPEMLALVRSIR